MADLGHPAGTYHGNAAFTADSHSGLALDDINAKGWLTVPDQSAIDVSSLTMAAWVKTTGSQNQHYNIILNKESVYEMAIRNGNELCSALAVGRACLPCTRPPLVAAPPRRLR